MLETILMSSALVCIIGFISFTFRGKVKARILYGLWGLVLLRLVIPIPLIPMPTFVENIFWTQSTMTNAEQELGRSTGATGYSEADDTYSEEMLPEERAMENHLQSAKSEDGDTRNVQEHVTIDASKGFGNNIDLVEIIQIVWIVVAVVMLLSIITINVLAYREIKKERRLWKSEDGVFVYLSTKLHTPCLYGVFHPAIYLPEEMMELSDQEIKLILMHERMHYKHLDHIWGAIRILTVSCFWFNPFIWIAAKASKNDAEYAADEAALNCLDVDQNVLYGEMILHVLRLNKEKSKILTMASTVGTSKKQVEMRLKEILTPKKKTTVWLVAVLALAILVTGCSFLKKNGATSNTTRASVTEDVSATADIATDQKNLDAAISAKLQEEMEIQTKLDSSNRYVDLTNTTYVESHTTLLREEKDNTNIVYLMMKSACYGQKSDVFSERGSIQGFRVMTLQKKSNQYEVTDVWQPETEDAKHEILRNKFPATVTDDELDETVYENKLNVDCHQQAMKNYNKNLTMGKVSKKTDAITGDVKAVDLYTSQNAVVQYSEDTVFIKKLVDAYNDTELISRTNETIAPDFDQLTTINYYLGDDSVRSISFDQKRNCIDSNGKTYIMNQDTFAYEEIQAFIQKNNPNKFALAEPYATSGFAITDYQETMDLLKKMKEPDAAVDAKVIEKRAKIICLYNGIGYQDEYDAEQEQFSNLIAQHKVALKYKCNIKNDALDTYMQIMSTSEEQLEQKKTLESYCKKIGITEEQYWSCAQKYYSISQFDFDKYKETRKITSEEELKKDFQNEIQNALNKE